MKLNGLIICWSLFFLGCACSALAQEQNGLSAYLPADNEAPGWKLDGPTRTFRGDDLFMMINGGADIYHEYGFVQVLAATFVNPSEETVKLEIYQMKSPGAAYGAYTFKAGEGGEEGSLGQEARLQDYYLNFWKGDLLVTLVGSNPDEQAMQGGLDLAKAVDARIKQTGRRPELASLLLKEPDALSQARYVRGPLGVMNSYIFDTKDIFHVREGVLGVVGECRVFVFQYLDFQESSSVYKKALDIFEASSRFSEQVVRERNCSMTDRNDDVVLVRQRGRFILSVIGKDQNEAASVLNRLETKLVQ